MSLTLLLARHGETAYNAENRYQGQRDIPLSAAGRAQAQHLGQRLAAAQQVAIAQQVAVARPFLPAPVSAIYTSQLQRAGQTAQIIANALEAFGGPNAAAAAPVPPIHTLPELAERAFGAWEGLTMAEIRAAFPGETEPRNGEPWPVVWDRMASALSVIQQAHPSSSGGGGENKTVLVVGHGGSLRAYVCRALGVGYEHVRRFRLDNASLSAVEFWDEAAPPRAGGEHGRVLLLNDTAHLFAPAGAF